jgi:hypothetical protein
MAYKYDPSRRQLFWFVINGLVQWDRQPSASQASSTLTRCVPIASRLASFAAGQRWPAHEGELLYRFNWEKKWAPRLATPSITA